MEVTELIENWDSSNNRERQWFFAEDAQEKINQDLAAMIDGLMARYMKVLE